MEILIVDDEPIAIQGVLDGVEWNLLDFSQIHSCGSYSEAVEILQNHRIDLAVCDIEMPDESGIELIGWINEHSPDTETIILSCHDEFDYARQAVTLHCLEYMLKPVRYDVLTEALRKAQQTIAKKQQNTIMTEYGQQYIHSMQEDEQETTEDTVEKVAHYIDENLNDNLSVSALAQMAYLSADHLTRSFKKRYGKTVSEYILHKRMQLARELLRDSKMTITMVAGKVGFGNYSYFTEQFKKYYHMTPREFQKKEEKHELSKEN